MVERTAGLPTLTALASTAVSSTTSANDIRSDRRTGTTIGNLMLTLAVGVLSTGLMTSSGIAQDNQYYHPLNQRMAPGEAAGWLSHIRGCRSDWLQPVRIDVPGGAQVSIYSASAEASAVGTAPAMVAVNPGHTYRLRLSEMPDYPDVELYPTIEILDRLHPPAGQAYHYPIPVPFSDRDIAHALEGRLVTRVIYLEQPQLAQPLDPLSREIPQAVLPSQNVLKRADQLGRPMVIVRLGSRRPAPHQVSAMFYGTGGAVQLPDQVEQPPQPQIKQTALRTP